MKVINRIVTISTLLLLLVSSSSCGFISRLDHQNKGVGYTRQFSTTDSQFGSYVAKFEVHARQELNNPEFKVNNVPVNFGDTENEEYVGVCFTYSNGDKEVIIDKTWWTKVSETSKESLLFHELGHCALNRTHNEETITKENRTIRASIMHPGVVSSMDYNTYKNGYIHELFTTNQQVLIQSL